MPVRARFFRVQQAETPTSRSSRSWFGEIMGKSIDSQKIYSNQQRKKGKLVVGDDHQWYQCSFPTGWLIASIPLVLIARRQACRRQYCKIIGQRIESCADGIELFQNAYYAIDCFPTEFQMKRHLYVLGSLFDRCILYMYMYHCVSTHIE